MIRLAGRLAGAGVHEESNNQAVKTKDFSENEDENHADEESGLLSGTTDTGVTNNTDGETSGKTSKTDGETGTELDETSEQRLLLGKLVGDQDGNDETVNGNNTSHNDGNNVLDDQVGPEHTHGRDTNTSLSGTVGSTEAGEDDGGSAAHRSEERGIHGAEIGRHGGCVCGVSFGR
jgi:hypothetical protein